MNKEGATMSGSIFGKCFQISTWGESHGKALGVTIDGCPAGLSLSEEDIQKELDRRKPGTSQFSTKREESDLVSILSGVFEGKTTGTPISMVVYNKDHHSSDYSQIAESFRPGHADYTFQQKYGFRDYRGGGRSSGRETLSRVAAGAVAKKLLEEIGISIQAYTLSIGPISIDREKFNLSERFQNPFVMPEKEAAKKADLFLQQCMAQKDSVGGVIECIVTGLPVGLGETVFDKLDACLAHAIFSIGAVKGFEIGSGFHAASIKGSENNDNFRINVNGKIEKSSNHAGGVLGGMSDGSPLIFRTALKPTPSIFQTQKTVTIHGEETEINIKGRHDPIIVPRAVVVVEAMTALALVDAVIQNMSAQLSTIKKFYQ